MITDPTNHERALWAAHVLCGFDEHPDKIGNLMATPSDIGEDCVADILSDIMHLCDVNRFSFSDLLARARNNYDEEHEESCTAIFVARDYFNEDGWYFDASLDFSAIKRKGFEYIFYCYQRTDHVGVGFLIAANRYGWMAHDMTCCICNGHGPLDSLENDPYLYASLDDLRLHCNEAAKRHIKPLIIAARGMGLR